MAQAKAKSDNTLLWLGGGVLVLGGLAWWAMKSGEAAGAVAEKKSATAEPTATVPPAPDAFRAAADMVSIDRSSWVDFRTWPNAMLTRHPQVAVFGDEGAVAVMLAAAPAPEAVRARQRAAVRFAAARAVRVYTDVSSQMFVFAGVSLSDPALTLLGGPAAAGAIVSGRRVGPDRTRTGNLIHVGRLW